MCGCLGLFMLVINLLWSEMEIKMYYFLHLKTFRVFFEWSHPVVHRYTKYKISCIITIVYIWLLFRPLPGHHQANKE